MGVKLQKLIDCKTITISEKEWTDGLVPQATNIDLNIISIVLRLV